MNNVIPTKWRSIHIDCSKRILEFYSKYHSECSTQCFCSLLAFVIASAVIMPAWLRLKEKERSQKIDNLPILASCRPGTSAMLSSTVNGLVTHGCTR